MTNDSVEAILSEFRSWLLSSQPGSVEQSSIEEPVDLHTLVSNFVALRQEVNLQTKASRSQLEQNSEALQTLARSVESLEQLADNSDATEEAVRPMLKTLVDLRDVLSLSGREIRKVGDNLEPALRDVLALVPNPAEQATVKENAANKHSWWGGMWGPSAAHAQKERTERQTARDNAEQLVARLQQMVGSLVTGYSMSVQRIDRALEQQDLEPIPTVGEAFDPETMEVVDVIVDPNRQTSEVVEEVRPGYMWNGKVFRYAQVKVARQG